MSETMKLEDRIQRRKALKKSSVSGAGNKWSHLIDKDKIARMGGKWEEVGIQFSRADLQIFKHEEPVIMVGVQGPSVTDPKIHDERKVSPPHVYLRDLLLVQDLKDWTHKWKRWHGHSYSQKHSKT